MKFKILIITALSSFLYGSASRSSTADLISHDDSHVAVILSLDEISSMNTTAANIDRALGKIRRCTALTHQKITDLQKETYEISEIMENLEMYTYMQEEEYEIKKSTVVMHWKKPTHHQLLRDDRYSIDRKKIWGCPR